MRVDFWRVDFWQVDATTQGVSLLARRVHTLLHAPPDFNGSNHNEKGSKGIENGSSNSSSSTAAGVQVAQGGVAHNLARLGELSQQLTSGSQQLTSGGAEAALGALAEMLVVGVRTRNPNKREPKTQISENPNPK